MEIKPAFQILLLLDYSGSMYGEKIESLKVTVLNFLYGLEKYQNYFNIAIGATAIGPLENNFNGFLPLTEFKLPKWEISGDTGLFKPLNYMMPFMEKNTIILLLSDGHFNDHSYQRLIKHMNKTMHLYAIAIGYDADTQMLKRFTKNEKKVFHQYDAEQLGYIIINEVIGALENETIQR